MSENHSEVEMHGCIVCARIFKILAVYTPDDKLVGFSISGPGAHRVPDEQHPLVACDTHPTRKIEAAYQRWKSRKGSLSEDE